jgi:outer membrane protein
MANSQVIIILLLTAVSGLAQSGPPAKIGLVHLQKALLGTKEGQAAAKELQSRAAAKEKPLNELHAEITKLRRQFEKSAAVSSPEQQTALTQEIDRKTKTFNRQVEDLRADLDGEQTRILNELGTRMLAVINQYATRAGYALIVDISEPQSPILHASDTLDVTSEIIKVFDAGAPKAP